MKRVLSFSSGGRGVSILTCWQTAVGKDDSKGWGVSVEQNPGQCRWNAKPMASFESRERDHSPAKCREKRRRSQVKRWEVGIQI